MLDMARHQITLERSSALLDAPKSTAAFDGVTLPSPGQGSGHPTEDTQATIKQTKNLWSGVAWGSEQRFAETLAEALIPVRKAEPHSEIAARLLARLEAHPDRVLRSLDWPRTTVAPTVLDTASPEAIVNAFPVLIDRLRSETTYFRGLSELGIDRAIRDGCARAELGTTVDFIGEQSPDKESGSYLPSLNLISVKGQEPTAKEMWQALLATGTLPPTVEVLHHELVHSHQYRGSSVFKQYGLTVALAAGLGVSASLLTIPEIGIGVAVISALLAGKIRLFFAPDDGLIEIHAREAAASVASYGSPSASRREIVKDILSGGYGASLLQRPRLAHAYDLIHSLRLLGLNDRELGALVSGARYDEALGTYPKLRDRLESIRKEIGLDDESEFQSVLSGLSVCHENEKLLQRELARRIAAEELARLQKPIESPTHIRESY